MNNHVYRPTSVDILLIPVCAKGVKNKNIKWQVALDLFSVIGHSPFSVNIPNGPPCTLVDNLVTFCFDKDNKVS
jgi:hypothetical protein